MSALMLRKAAEPVYLESPVLVFESLLSLSTGINRKPPPKRMACTCRTAPDRVTRGRLLGFKWGSNSTLVNVVLNSCRENSPMPPMQNTKQALPMFVTGKVPRESKMGSYTILTIYDVYLRIYRSRYHTWYHGARKGAYD